MPAVEAVPDSVRQTSWAVRVDTQKLADGAFILGAPRTTASAVEFKDYIAVVEALSMKNEIWR